MNSDKGISVFIGKTPNKIDVNYANDDIIFYFSDNSIYKMYHDQDCCESVTINDICGNINDLLNSEIIMAEEIFNENDDKEDFSFTWSFYKLATSKGYVTIRWYGESNGYYSESVSIRKISSIEGIPS